MVEVSVTEFTLAAMPAASGLLENEAIAEERAEPFCSRESRLAVGVDELKNASQLVVISAAAPELVPVPETVAEAVALAEALAAVVAADVAVGGVVDGEVELLEQAVAVSATTMAPAIARPVAGWNLIASLREFKVGYARLLPAFLPSLSARRA
ncbi:MAG TPA: hypothetical protein VI365_09550 [Trebonia sp.]